ncbi:ATP/GTP-binding protein [Streptomyces triticagri]|uniref:ATP/GTP-binding protein n=1 Tax=Streptomyces triticagri TaxID=2293568 RepID=A0A372M0E3_9ACTN|nr:ATP/GTP-binding protein [Streptomyces triticagri]RFU83757.1 ATP/GTP-binding protein [Streptomyces triticagri]
MHSAPVSDGMYLAPTVERAVKILVVGHFGVGKTTLVGGLSEITPLRTEEVMTKPSELVDDLSALPDKTTTTVALDFGRLTLTQQLVLYLFGAPGQDRFKGLWQDLAYGALGALVLADTRALQQSFEVFDRVEEYGLPYAVAVNHFTGSRRYDDEEVREALDLHPETPLVTCDARDVNSSSQALITLVEYLHNRAVQKEAP